jgi:hypothetical protein
LLPGRALLGLLGLALYEISGKLHPRSFCKKLQRFSEINPLALLYEREDIPLRPATETVEALAFLRDVERGRLLIVEGASRFEALPRFLKLNVTSDNLGYI